ncbi:hypothetical protein A3732_16985 [Oleiphilus sp. HI0050]|nr:hypothetical protein A3732_19455 [Oleiphilus sp. HI0050]KZY42118.1 hypothetical protein A3732_16985 [Oleiphilus sp. HI0050]
MKEFVTWYNTEHRHSRINFVTPEQRHLGLDEEILSKRDELYRKMKRKNQIRWSKATRNWEKVGDVKLNPEKEKQAA